MRYAQILYNKAHWILETDETLAQLYQRFAPDIVFVEITGMPVEEGWDYDGTTFIAPAQPTLLETQDKQWEQIKAERDRREQSGFPYMGKTFDSDALSVQRISIAAQAAQAAISANQAFSIDWTCADDSVLTMTAQDMISVPVALAQYSDSLHQTARGLREQIYAATTADEVQAITWPI
jgi:hypothetical protein